MKFLVMWELDLFARYDVYPLAEMETSADVLRASDEQEASER